jgi:hypothetical protein
MLEASTRKDGKIVAVEGFNHVSLIPMDSLFQHIQEPHQMSLLPYSIFHEQDTKLDMLLCVA